MDDLVPLGTLSKPHDSSNEQRTCDATSSLACVPMHVERPSDAVEVADSTSATAHVSATPSASRSAQQVRRKYQAGQPRKVLHIFSGVADRIDGFATMMLGLYKVEVVEYDTLISADFDLTDSKVWYLAYRHTTTPSILKRS